MKTLLASTFALVLFVTPPSPGSMTAPIWIQRLGWVLVHSLWQLTLIAIISVIIDRLLIRRSANTRYIAAVTAFCLMAVVPLATWSVDVELDQRSAGPPTAVQNAKDVGSPAITGDPVKGLIANESSAPSQIDSSDTQISSADRPALTQFESRTPQSLPGFLAAWINAKLPWIVRFWFVGIVVCSIRPICGLWTQSRLRRCGLSPVPETLQATLTQLAERMRLTKIVRIAQSSLVKVPMVAGYLRPVILLPTSVIIGLTPTQLEALLAHELAHVRRHDWLINTLQVIAETLLFYHPAVWWLSNRIRQEREVCCDDIALSVNVDKAVYARTLLTLEELRQKTFTPALAATGGDLASRVRRLLPSAQIESQSGMGVIVGLLSLCVSLMLLATTVAAPNPPQESDSVAVTEKPDEPVSTDTQEASNARQLTLKVLDEAEQPVVGAAINWTFRFPPRNGVGNSVVRTGQTDEDGISRINIPDGATDDWVVSVMKEGFNQYLDGPDNKESPVVHLQRGRFIHVRAVDETGQLLKQAVPLLEDSRTLPREFVPQADGTFKSPSVAFDRRMMRVVAAQKDGPMLFSTLVDISTAEPGDDGVLELVLRKGTRLTGRLDNSVPRPVSEGYVTLRVVQNVIPPLGERNHGEWYWDETAPVQSDGTFQFDSLPPEGHAQFFYLGNGYVSTNPSEDTIREYVRTHDLTQDDSEIRSLVNSVTMIGAMKSNVVFLDQQQVDVTIECQRTASCEFRILDAAGNPVPNATVAFNPNPGFVLGGQFIPGFSEFQTAYIVDSAVDGVSISFHDIGRDKNHRGIAIRKERAWAVASFHGVKSDADGLVKIRNLPGGGRESFSVLAEGYVMPKSHWYPGFEDRRDGYIELINGDTVEATIYLDRDESVEPPEQPEREQDFVDREILVQDGAGHPIEGVTVSLAEMRIGPKDWHRWSDQRFGRLQSGTTNQEGRILIRVPRVIDNSAVERIRLAINVKNEAFNVVGGLVIAPLKEDQGFVTLPTNRYGRDDVRYVWNGGRDPEQP